MTSEDIPVELAIKHNKDIFKIRLLSAVYDHSNSEDEREAENQLWSIAIIGENEINYYVLHEDEYNRLEKAIRRWIKKTFNRCQTKVNI